MGDKIVYDYNANGYLKTITNEVGLVTTVTSWDWRGAPLTVEDPNGVQTTFTYDIHGRVLTATVDPGANESQYTFQYTAMGDIARVTLPRGGFLEYDYDHARRLTTITNDRGQTQTFDNDDNGDTISQTIAGSGGGTTFQQTAEYDELGRIIKLIGVSGATTSFGYDKVNNPLDVTDGRGNLFHSDYDALNRVITETDPLNHSVHYGYDPLDNLTSFTDGRGLQTTRLVSGFGEVVREVSPDRGTWNYGYDRGGRLTKQIDGSSVETDFTYDDAGRRLTATFPSSSAENISYTYDSVTGGNSGLGRLTKVTDQTGSTRFAYDHQGRVTSLTKVVSGHTYVTSYTYDTNGKVTSITLPSGRVVTYTRAIDGLTTNVASGTTNYATSVTYMPFGPPTTLTYGNGLALTRSFNQNYWINGITVDATGAHRLDLTIARDNNGAVQTITDNLVSHPRSASYTYFADQRLKSGTGTWGEQDYLYDAAGNRTRITRIISGVTTIENANLNAGTTQNNRVKSVTDSNGVPLRTFTYTNGGSVQIDIRTGAPNYSYTYNARERMATATKNGGSAGSYAYDAFDERVSRQTFGGGAINRNYIFDAEGRLMAEHDAATGAVIREYIWIDDMPVAMVQYPGSTSPATYYIHTGQIGEPLMMTDASKAIVWNNVMDPYGTATPLGTDTVTLDLRYPGQWLQPETGGLAQNWFRDYDASLGRYAQADPLNRIPLPNTYSYAASRPLSAIDPDGQFSTDAATIRIALARAGAAELAGGGPEDPAADIAALVLIAEQ